MWGAVTRVLRSVASAAPVAPQGISLSGAMHSLFPVADDAGTPIANAMTWADARAAVVHGRLVAGRDTHAIYRRTGCPVHSTYHLQRLRWWHEYAPEQARAAHLWVGLKDWILHELARVWATDLSLASTTGLLSLRDLAWDAEALELAGVGADRLPALVSPSAVVGKLTEEAAAAAGLPAGLPVVAGGSDGAMANLGTGTAAPGGTVITVGTSGAVRRMVGAPWFDPGERTWCYLLDEGLYFVGGAINNGGLALEWVRDRLYPDLAGPAGFEQLASDAASVAPGAEGVFMLPYFAGERSPYWAPDDRAMLYGLGVGHTRAHIARAAMEGVANCLADVWDALNGTEEGGQIVRLTGGITRTPPWAQILADMLGVELMASEAADASAMGAALLGMRALGLPGAGGLARTVEPGRTYTPDQRSHRFYTRHHRAHKALRLGMAAMGEALEDLEESAL
jgi:gluconokinase